ncbi:DUF3662 and FHA domain-containing protein [Dermatophilaceae bacterium Soc4.6]
MGLFDRVERGLERAVNGAFAKAFKSEVQPVEIASAIRRAMDDRAAVVSHGRTMVPNLYSIELSASDYGRLSEYEDALADELVAAAQEHAETQRYQPSGPFAVDFSQGDDLETGVFRVRPGTSRRTATDPDARAEPPARPLSPAPSSAPPPSPSEAYERPQVPPPARGPAQRPWLTINGERYPLIGALTVLGRDEGADIILDDPGISRRHCEVRVSTDGPHLVTSVRDLRSTNGTYVNGERVTSRRLGDGDQITVGRTQAVFRPGKR